MHKKYKSGHLDFHDISRYNSGSGMCANEHLLAKNHIDSCPKCDAAVKAARRVANVTSHTLSFHPGHAVHGA